MLNRVSLVGRITRDIELRNSVNGKSYVAFTLAVNNNFNNKAAAFIPCFAWNKVAENMAKFLKKGSLIALDGKLQTRTELVNNNITTIVQVVADIVSFLDNKSNLSVFNNVIEYNENFDTMSDSNNYEFDDALNVNDKEVLDVNNNNFNKVNEEDVNDMENPEESDDAIIWD